MPPLFNIIHAYKDWFLWSKLAFGSIFAYFMGTIDSFWLTLPLRGREVGWERFVYNLGFLHKAGQYRRLQVRKVSFWLHCYTVSALSRDSDWKKCSCTFGNFVFLLWGDTGSHVLWSLKDRLYQRWTIVECIWNTDGVIIKRRSCTYSEKKLSCCHVLHRKFCVN
jgi:hypothetical protein